MGVIGDICALSPSILGNLTRIFPMSSLIYASFLISYFNLQFIFTGNGPALCFNKFGKYLYLFDLI